MLFPFPLPFPAFDFFGKVPIQGRVIPENVLSLRTDPASEAFVWIYQVKQKRDKAYFLTLKQKP